MKMEMIDLGAGGYPTLAFKDLPMPFVDSDIGKVFEMKAVVVLEDISPQGFGYEFRLKKVCFPEKDSEVTEFTQRSVERQAKADAGNNSNINVNIKT